MDAEHTTISKAMDEKGITRKDLMVHFKSRGRISSLLTGKRAPSKNEIAMLRYLLGISADELIPEWRPPK